MTVGEKGAEDAGEREEGGSRLQVAVGRSYRLGEGRDPSGLWHVKTLKVSSAHVAVFHHISFLNIHVSHVALEVVAITEKLQSTHQPTYIWTSVNI